MSPVETVPALIVGASGTGKTWLGTKLAPALGLPRLAIDDFGKPGSGRWTKLLLALEETEGKVLVESCAVPSGYRLLIGLTIHLQARPGVRKRRLLKRGETLATARRLVRDADRTPRRGDINLRGDLSVSDVADLADRLAALGWAAEEVGGNPKQALLDTAPQAGKKVYGFANASRKS